MTAARMPLTDSVTRHSFDLKRKLQQAFMYVQRMGKQEPTHARLTPLCVKDGRMISDLYPGLANSALLRSRSALCPSLAYLSHGSTWME
eukprot:4123780-Amphidinium_carterae.1